MLWSAKQLDLIFRKTLRVRYLVDDVVARLLAVGFGGGAGGGSPLAPSICRLEALQSGAVNQYWGVKLSLCAWEG